MEKANSSGYDDYINEIKIASLEQQRGELEVRLGQARLEGDFIKMREIEAQLAKVHAEANPPLRATCNGAISLRFSTLLPPYIFLFLYLF